MEQGRENRDGPVLFLTQLPPPHHGQSAVAAAMYRVLTRDAGLDVVHRWRGGAASNTDIGRRTLAKYLGFARLLVELAGEAISGRRYRLAYVGMTPWAHTVLRDAVAAGMAKLLARRVWLHVHGDGLKEILETGGLRNRLIRALIRSTELIAITEETGRIAEASGVFSRVAHLPNAAADPGIIQHGVWLPLSIGCLGNLDPRKGVLDFVEIVAGLARSGVPASGVIVGGETAELSLEAVRQAIADAGADGVIEATGRVSEARKSDILSELDIFLYLSRHDLAPIALIEALAHGAVPIVLDIGGIREMVGPALAPNVLDPIENREALAERIAEIVVAYAENPGRLAADKAFARERYIQNYSPVRFSERVRALIAAGTPRQKRRPVAHARRRRGAA